MANFYEIEAAFELKWSMITEARGKCTVCGIEFKDNVYPELAHRIPKHIKWIKKYGKDIIHHKLNLAVTCSKCNSSVLIDPESLPGQELIKQIREDLNEHNS